MHLILCTVSMAGLQPVCDCDGLPSLCCSSFPAQEPLASGLDPDHYAHSLGFGPDLDLLCHCCNSYGPVCASGGEPPHPVQFVAWMVPDLWTWRVTAGLMPL